MGTSFAFFSLSAFDSPKRLLYNVKVKLQRGTSNNTKNPLRSLRILCVKKRLNRKVRKELRKVSEVSIRCAFGTQQYKKLIFRSSLKINR